MTRENTTMTALPDEPDELPPTVIRTAQDCIDFGTVEFNASTVVKQGAKRSIPGECVVTGRQFEAVYLHRDPMMKDRNVGADEPMHHFSLNRVWQYLPEKVDVEVCGVPYGQLREMTVPFGSDGTTIGPTVVSQTSNCEELHLRLKECHSESR
jgi:hypothetical protein